MRELPRLVSGMVALFLGVLPAMAAAPADGPAKGQPLPPFSEVQQTVLAVLRGAAQLPARRSDHPRGRETAVGGTSEEGASAGRREADFGKGARQRRIPGRPIEHAEWSEVHASDRRVSGRLRPARSAQPSAARAADRPRPDSGPGGEKMIEYMTTTKGGRELGRCSPRPRRGEFQCVDGPHLYRRAVVGPAAAEPCGGPESGGRQEISRTSGSAGST